ncbi:MAG: 5-oxoprolinase subunit PxpB [Chloroflexi bacterium]|nr:MAG: 5-oxoprolinase subunit PxpB [Chloroflexota bacterium]
MSRLVRGGQRRACRVPQRVASHRRWRPGDSRQARRRHGAPAVGPGPRPRCGGTVPAYASLLCHYDPGVTDAARLEASIRQLEGRVRGSMPSGSIVEIPTRYDGADLGDVALKTNLTPAGVIALHASREYLVYCVGFAPGFTYCGSLPDELSVPRLASPRTRVPAGSVGIAGQQTGIYAVESPGGWNLIGRTDMRLFDPMADPPARFRAGDRLRFVPVS